MVDPRSQRFSRSRKKSLTPLSNLRTSEVVRTVVNHPRRLAELISLLEDKDRTVRGRAAATLARLSERYAGRLLRNVDRLKEGLSDDSAYVRWTLSYALGRIGCSYPNKAAQFLEELASRTEDNNRVVRILAIRALGRIASQKPQLVRESFVARKRELPGALARALDRPQKKR
jgi:HEAT repeat protein